MKKFLGVILVLVCFITPAFAEPVSQEVLNQARTQAGLFMDLKNALGLEWLDEYNIYLTDPTGNPAPSWASSVDELINKNYLSVAFPTDFTISPSGKEVTISRTITNQGIKDALPIYLPSISISGDTVSLLVQRPAQWVAWEAGLNSKISRDGEGYSDGGLDVLADTILEFGTRTGIEFASDSKIEFINGDGKLVGIDSLEYKDQELDDRFVNVTGETMSGSLTAPEYRISDVNTRIYKGEANSVRIQTNFGRVDIGPQDVNYAHFSTDRSKFLFDEPVHVKDRIQIYGVDTYLAATEGKIDGHEIWHSGNDGPGSGLDADTLDGDHASSFSRVGHGHNYVSRLGDTMEGNLTMTGGAYVTSSEYRMDNSNARIYSPGDNQIRIQTGNDYVDIVPTSLDYVRFLTERPEFYFNKPLKAETRIQIYGSNTYFTATQGKISGGTVWHSGNDGPGSGLNADMLDGLHSSGFIVKPILVSKYDDLNDYKEPGMYHWGGGQESTETLKNCPSLASFVMLVEGSGTVVQTLKETCGLGLPSWGRIWKRQYNSGRFQWTPWQEIVDIPENFLRYNVYTTVGYQSLEEPATYTWIKGSGTQYVIAYVWGSVDYPDQPKGISRFGDYLESSSNDDMVFAIIDVTNVSSVPVTVGAGRVVQIGGRSYKYYLGCVAVEEYSSYPMVTLR